MLEATLLFGGMGLHDQHSDLRLDVDNMSYEVPHFSVCYFIFLTSRAGLPALLEFCEHLQCIFELFNLATMKVIHFSYGYFNFISSRVVAGIASSRGEDWQCEYWIDSR